MTNVVRFNVVNKEPVELEIDDASAIDALNDVQVKKLHDALDEFLNVTPIEDGDFFDRIIESGVVYFYVPASGNKDEVIPKAESAQD